ncbi:MAG: Ig-like domain-containing protein, partial [Gemmatimonadetes bacterium]|nr:Ig-like domain-containing protein [Gemmatimonadota bacterium]
MTIFGRITVPRRVRGGCRSSLAIALLGASAACGGDGTPVAPVPSGVVSVQVSAPADTAVLGESMQLTATARDAAGNALSGRSVAWGSSSESVATVSAGGMVTAVAAGTATITATV